MSVGREINMLQMLRCKMRVILCDCRTLVGTFAAYDQKQNVVLTDCVEYKMYKAEEQPAVEGKINRGVVLIRGKNITDIIVEEQPPQSSSRY